MLGLDRVYHRGCREMPKNSLFNKLIDNVIGLLGYYK